MNKTFFVILIIVVIISVIGIISYFLFGGIKISQQNDSNIVNIPVECNQYQGAWKQDCFLQYLVSKNDSSLCKNLDQPDLIGACYMKIAINLNDPKICEMIKEKLTQTEHQQEQYNACYEKTH